MDRRTLMAFVLSFVVLVGFAALTSRLSGPRPAAHPAASPAAIASGDSAGAAAARAAQAPADTTAAPVVAGSPLASADPLRFVPAAGAPVRVATDLYELTIDPVGARLTSWRSLRFKDADGKPVELIPADAPVPGPGQGDAAIFERATLDLSAAPYQTDAGPDLRLAAGDPPRSVTFTARTEGGMEVRKTYTFEPGRYDFTVDLDVAGSGPARALVGQPVRARFAWTAGITSTERNPKLESIAFRSFAMVGEEIQFKARRALGKDAAKVRATYEGAVRFAGVQNKYFLIAGFVADAKEHPVAGMVHLDGAPERGQQTWWVERPLTLRAGTSGARLSFYLGPSQYDVLKSYRVGLEKSVDLGWKIFHPLAALTLGLMTWLYRWLPNYGLIIILLSVLTKVAFYPLTVSSTRSMKRMQEVQPKLKALQEKYKGNQEKLSQEMMKLYKEEKINPMGGCLPMLLQMPVFVALYQVLRGDIALRQAPFVWWIRDLGQPDALFRLPFALPFFGHEFNLLPILMAASTYWQVKITPSAPAGGASMAMMNKLMPVMMLVFFYSFPSGLVLYWLVNNLLTIYQTWRIHVTTPVRGGAQA
ncbi:MAG: membrane protein insertase YidC [Candidatus Krumholzibacteriia bacterium]